MPEAFQFYTDTLKYDTDGESLLVSGILSTPAQDRQGDIVEPEAMRKALGDYLLNGTCREMHQPIAAGKPVSAYVDDDGKTHLTAKIVDKNTIAKVKEGVLKGFSIGAKSLKKVGNRIKELALYDASLVDRPANPECVFTLVKFDKPGDRCSDPQCEHHVEGHTEKCASCLSKSETHFKCSHCGTNVMKGMTCACRKSHHEHAMKTMLLKALNLPDATSDEDLQKALTTRLTLPPPKDGDATLAAIAGLQGTITKLTGEIGDLKKVAEDAKSAATDQQRKSILQKMEREGRCPMKPAGVAYKLDELQKMDIPTLEILAINSPQIPIESIHLFKGDGKPGDPRLEKLTGTELMTAAWEAEYGDLNKMLSIPSRN
jgi:hypothetical protein